MEKFIKQQNIEHYRSLLRTTTDEAQRKVIRTLLAEEEASGQGDDPGPNGDPAVSPGQANRD